MSSCAQQPPEFPITHNIGAAIRLLFHSQLFITPPAPTQTFTNQTVIITGANRGVGLEAARHFYRLDCARLILAVRDVERGQVAKENILSSVESRARSESDTAAIEVWYLDLRSTESTIAFADRVKTELDRVDVLVENAGIHTGVYELVEGVGSAVQVNILNTCLLALLLLPKLEENSGKRDSSGSVPHLVVVSSEAHRYTSFPEINEPDLYEGMKGRELGWEKFPR
jgi:NAD(P)-dependent dehydrogenase (short-subunit alcohol dehydrogenase family)